MPHKPSDVITVSLNPAIDRILEVPRLRLGAHQRGRLISRTPAGKAVNVSRALAVLGVRNVATGFLGKDEVELFENSLDTARIQPQFLPVDGTTRENVTLIDPVSHMETHIRDIGFAISEKDRIRLGKKLHLMSRPGSVVVFSGSVPDGISPPQFAELLQVCISAGAHVVVDTSGPPLQAAAELPIWLLKPNVGELAEIAGRPLTTDAEVLAAGLEVARRATTVVVSRGEAGGFCFVAGSALKGHVAIRQDRVRNTVGCGDCLLAGFIAARVQGHDIRESYRHALAVATAAAISVEPSHFLRQDVEEFLAVASVDPIEHELPAQNHQAE
ncbi:MAG: 1-phosphofructokinase family hexose kinase [Phycisphaerae bacterium]|nr:1-phosphofructokinase family hexose kinase [Phycisphaerae bacterium]